MSVILIGLGHEMHGDDEIGLEVVRQWSRIQTGKESGEGIHTSLLKSPGINLLSLIAGRDAAILVAAIHSGARPGTIQRLNKAQLISPEGIGRKGGGGGAAETLSLGYQLAPEELPDRLILIGIEGAAFGLGEGLSPAVRAAIPEALDALDQSLAELTQPEQFPQGMIKQVQKALQGFRRLFN